MRKLTGKTIALIVVLVALAAGSWFMFGRTAAGIEYPNADKYTVGDAVIPGAVNNLFVDWTAGKVTVEYYDGADIKVTETANRTLSDDDKLRWWLDGDTLRIRYAKAGFRISFNLDKQLTVSLPRDLVLKSADIGSTSADIYAPALKADEIRLNSTSGNIEAGTDTKKLAASSTSGDVRVLQGGSLDSADLSSTSGSLSLGVEGSVKNVSANSTSGGVALTVSGSAGNVKLHSTSGNIYPTLSSLDKAEISATSGSVTGTVNAFKDLKVNTSSGSVNLMLGTEPGFTCRVSSSSGDFTTALSMTKNGDTYTCGDGSAKCDIGTSSGDIWIGNID